MKIVHLISNLRRINFGVWNAALSGASVLAKKHETRSIAWITDAEHEYTPVPHVTVRFTGTRPDRQAVGELIGMDGLSPADTVFVSHGCWLGPARVGAMMKKMGFRFLYTPHGMLEPWSLQQARLKKRLYYILVEKRIAMAADRIRAVSDNEGRNLERLLKRKVDVINNYTPIPELKEKPKGITTFLFLGRLHQKKGVLPMVKAWNNINAERFDRKLIIAGPDEGELAKMDPYLGKNIEYRGAVYGDNKRVLLENAHYFLLPSFSEGFPTSVIEAMSYGLIPLVSQGCNLPAIFERNLGYRTEPDEDSIGQVLKMLNDKTFNRDMSASNYNFVKENYSEEKIIGDLYSFYNNMLH